MPGQYDAVFLGLSGLVDGKKLARTFVRANFMVTGGVQLSRRAILRMRTPGLKGDAALSRSDLLGAG
ncbi:hypothetical protein MB46_17365 [Arthrobacter alpinus]|nr:hypothetical protein MB46_17365 [Arthrobacter alpinus]